MASKLRSALPLLAGGLLLGLAAGSLAQAIQEPRLRGNPNRTPGAGGACVYDRDGRAVFTPSGKYCPDASDHLSTPRRAEPPVPASYPPALRDELRRLLGDHDHIAQEIARLRRAVENRDQRIALEAVDKIRLEVTDHRAREEAFFEKMAPNPTSPRDPWR